MESINLTDDQCLYLQTIFDYFYANSKWPTHKYLDRHFNRIYPDWDIEEIVQHLPGGFTNPVDLRDDGSKAMLTIPAVCQCQGSNYIQARFTSIIRACVGRYFNGGDDKPQISSDELTPSSWPENSAHKIGLLLLREPDIWSSFTGPDDEGRWRLEIARDIRRFRGVTTIKEYLEKREIPRKSTTQPAIPIVISTPDTLAAISANDFQLHPEIQAKCWDLYISGRYDDAILNATKALEVAVRAKAGLPQSCVGVDVINSAFSVKKPILRYSNLDAEQEGMMSLLRGIIQVFKNPQSHRFVGVQDKSECFSLLLMCSNMLYVIDNTSVVGSM